MDIKGLVNTLSACSTRAAKLLLDEYRDVDELIAAAEAGEVNASEAGSIIASLGELTEDDGVIINFKFSPSACAKELCLINIEWQLVICTDNDLEVVQNGENISVAFSEREMINYALANYEALSKAVTLAILGG